MGFNIIDFHRFAAILLKTLECIYVVILDKILMEDADETLLLYRYAVHREVLRNDLFIIDRGQFSR